MLSSTNCIRNDPSSTINNSLGANDNNALPAVTNVRVVETGARSLNEELGGSYDADEPEEDDLPRGRKRTRSDHYTVCVSPLEEIVDLPISTPCDDEAPIVYEVDEPQNPCQILEQSATKSKILRFVSTNFDDRSQDQMVSAAEEMLASDAILTRTQSEEDIDNASKELFLSTHAPGWCLREAPDVSKYLNRAREGQESDIASADLENEDEDSPLPNTNDSSLLWLAPDLETFERRSRHCDTSHKSFLEFLAFDVPPTIGDKALEQFLKSSIEKTSALHADGTWASRMKAKEIERIVECVLVDEKRIDLEIDKKEKETAEKAERKAKADARKESYQCCP